jgi:hypothetical protein
MSLPTAKEFRKEFLEAFNECCEEARRYSFEEAWANWTAFMTGKNTKIDSWGRQAVLPTVAQKFGLQIEPEFMRLDLVLYEKGGCPLAVAIEHENDTRGLDTELDKLFLIRSRLKVLITFVWDGNKEFVAVKAKLEDRIRKYHRYYAKNLLPESSETEYLFFLGHEEMPKSITWYHLSFGVSQDLAQNRFEISR